MPQASDELRNKMDLYFNNGGVSDTEPEAYLKSRGFTFDWGGMISPPKDIELISKDWDCVQFMIDEWDYGYIE